MSGLFEVLFGDRAEEAHGLDPAEVADVLSPSPQGGSLEQAEGADALLSPGVLLSWLLFGVGAAVFLLRRKSPPAAQALATGGIDEEGEPPLADASPPQLGPGQVVVPGSIASVTLRKEEKDAVPASPPQDAPASPDHLAPPSAESDHPQTAADEPICEAVPPRSGAAPNSTDLHAEAARTELKRDQDSSAQAIAEPEEPAADLTPVFQRERLESQAAPEPEPAPEPENAPEQQQQPEPEQAPEPEPETPGLLETEAEAEAEAEAEEAEPLTAVERPSDDGITGSPAAEVQATTATVTRGPAAAQPVPAPTPGSSDLQLELATPSTSRPVAVLGAPKAVEYMATFLGPPRGPALGMKFAKHGERVRIRTIAPGKQAASMKQLKVGLLLAMVGEQVRKRISFVPFYTKKDNFTTTGSGQT
eukprot:COSAG06_NODE_6624_length_2851_cov_2.615189_2_plen_419_part_00